MRSPQSRRGGILKGLLIALLVLVAAVAGLAVYVVRYVHVATAHRAAGDNFSIDTPAGRISLRARDHVNPVTLGIPIYPGAVRNKDGGGASFEWTSRDGTVNKAVSVSGGDLTTDDSVEKVVDFYRRQLPDWTESTDHDGETRFDHKSGGHRKIVAIREKRDGTHIGVAEVGEPESN